MQVAINKNFELKNLEAKQKAKHVYYEQDFGAQGNTQKLQQQQQQ